MTLYRTYRPQKISELDNGQIRERLVKLLSTSHTPHAFLFVGPKGTGKTSAARIVAKSLNCSARQSGGEPCNKCEMCISITNGSNLDVMEIDAASNRGIDEIRDLREKIKLTPLSAKYKVYIIDEVHMLTNEAFNALLKTLEEPPSHAIFILATTEPTKLPETIVSRCITLLFHKADEDEILHALKRITAGEHIKVEDVVLRLIAGASDGSFRDATKLLEQAILEDSTTEKKINTILGNDIDGANGFIDALLLYDGKKALQIIALMQGRGIQMKLFLEQVLLSLHNQLLLIHGIGEDIQKMKDKNVSARSVIDLIKLLSRAYFEMRMVHMEQLPVEVAVVEWCEKKSV